MKYYVIKIPKQPTTEGNESITEVNEFTYGAEINWCESENIEYETFYNNKKQNKILTVFC